MNIQIIVIIIVIILALLLIRYINMAELIGADAFSITGSAAAHKYKVSPTITDAYESWSRATKQYKLITQRMNPKDTYEANAILERWHIALYNSPKDRDSRNITNAPATLKMRAELLEKRLFTDESVDAMIDSILKVDADPIPEDALNEGPEIYGSALRFGRFTKVLSTERMRLLKGSFDDKSSNDKSLRDQLLAVAMRYASLAPGGQQWSIPFQVAQVLVNKYDVTIEGFASPFNSQILRVAGSPQEMARRDLRYYSLFPDLDSTFGSAGNFFESKLAGRSSMINPPYIISIMDDVVTKCIEECDHAAANRDGPQQTRMFIIVPKWTDADYYKRLSESKYLEKILIHPPFKHFYEDANNSDKRIAATFAGTYFILSVGLPTDNKYLDLEEAVAKFGDDRGRDRDDFRNNKSRGSRKSFRQKY